MGKLGDVVTAQQKPIQVMIVDDHPMVRDGLKVFLSVSPGMECSGEASSGEEALELCRAVKPDVVLMDLLMPGMGGVAAIQAIRQHLPHVRIIALTSFAEQDLVHQAIRAGAAGYLLKNVTMDDLAEAIRAAYAGRPVMAPEATAAMMQALSQPAVESIDLTERERQILSLMVDGLSNQEIAYRLVVSESTARFHVSNVLMKLGVNNRTAAVRTAIQLKLL
jgi:two-component system, NarL family, response regulator LiaR